MPVAENIHQVFKETASGYLALGWSVLPVWGDAKPELAKVAAVEWSIYQRRRAPNADLDLWYSRRRCAGLGIVTGTLSQLVVLDFDDPQIAQTFEAQCPNLASTRTVLTRRGFHFYFHIPPHFHVQTRKLAGVDLLSDGCYVVAPPTVIDGHEYRVGRGGLPKTLDQADIQRINAFLDAHAQKRAVAPAEQPKAASGVYLAECEGKTQEGAFPRQHESLLSAPASESEENATFLTGEALVRWYEGLARQGSRNVALFKTACLARDHGWQLEATISMLAGAHIGAPAVGQHRHESPRARHREAVRTVRSAFSKPVRRPKPKDAGGLFNSIREKLFQLGQTCVVRVLEGLRLAGFKAGQLVSERTVLHVLCGLVGRHSIRLALAATTPSGATIFERISPRYPPRCDAATPLRIARQTNASVNRSKPDSIRGRPELHYRIPSLEVLCTRLGVAASGSDPITLDDLQSAKKTRQALHRELIRRRPGQYLRQWLGNRLGVSGVTIWRYNQQIAGLNVTPTFTQTPISWGNLNAIPTPDATPAGTCLEDSTGKRWPAVKGIAQRLLGQGRAVKLLVRSLNYYWYGIGDPPMAAGFIAERAVEAAPPVTSQEPIVTFAQRIERLVRVVTVTERAENEALVPKVPESTAPAIRGTQLSASPVSVHYTKGKRQSRYWKPLPNAALEALALKAYRRINELTANPNHKVSLVSVRRWIDRYGETRLKAALAILEQRPNVQKPGGLVATLLRTAGQ